MDGSSLATSSRRSCNEGLMQQQLQRQRQRREQQQQREPAGCTETPPASPQTTTDDEEEDGQVAGTGQQPVSISEPLRAAMERAAERRPLREVARRLAARWAETNPQGSGAVERL